MLDPNCFVIYSASSLIAFSRPDTSAKTLGALPAQAERLVRVNPVTGQVQVFKPVATADGKGVRLLPVQSQMCPAALIETGQHSWKFLGDERGHLFYDLDT